MNSPTPLKLLLIIFAVFKLNSYAQENNSSNANIGFGTVNFLMHGDLTSKNPNLGYYVYFNKMITPVFGFELKGQFLNLEGSSQNFSEDYNVIYTTENAQDLYFEGDSFGGELNLVLNFNELINSGLNDKKLNFNGYIGIGYHTYNSKLFNQETDEILLDLTARNVEAKSVYYTSGLGIKYSLSDRFDIELRQSINFNNEDHLDATISKKQEFETFFTTQLGISINLFNKSRSRYKVVINEPIIEKKEIELMDSDGDGVIDKFDKEPNTDKNAFVYANGVTIDSDKDGVPNHLDKCPLVFGTNKDGCNDIVSKPKTDVIIDSDYDGFPDDKDSCPNVHSLTNNGCPETEKEEIKPVIIDSDNDGFSDENDACPNEYSKTNNGCPEKEIVEEVVKTSAEYDKEKALIESIMAKSKTAKETENTSVIINQSKIDESERIKNPNHKIITELNKNSIKHNVYELDNAVNVLSIGKSPVHPECKSLDSEFKIRNCLITKISVYSLKNFKAENISKKGLNKGVNLMRILFVIDENGKAKIHKIIGDWDTKLVLEANRVINSLPKITPGRLNNIPTPVKFSMELPFKVSF